MSIGLVGIGLPTGMAGWKLLQNKTPADFQAFSKDPRLQRDLAYLREKLPAKATSQDLLADRRLQEMVLKAYGLDAQVGMDGLMRKVLDSDVADSGSVAARMTDSRYRQIARDLNYGGVVIPEIPAVPALATVTVEGLRADRGFTSFTGRFGGVTVEDLSLRGARTPAAVAARLQAAFQKADGGRGDIRVTASGDTLTFSDARARGKAEIAFAPGSAGVSAKLASSSAGSAAVPAQGGPQVGKAEVVEQIAKLYTQAKFEESLGETSDSLRKAIYAKRMLPQITSWYSVIADRNLAAVVQGVLGLPDSFASLDVDRQKAVLEQRMDIAEFKDGAKLSKLLERYVAQSSVAEAKALASASGIVTLVQPVSWGQDSFSAQSAAAIFTILGGG